MAKQNSKVLGIIAWITGIIVSLAVGFGMVDGVLTVRLIPEIVTVVVGWIVIGTTLLSAILAILKK
ncbi:hypothetical protein KAJ87_00445 [Candidatus Pacearchaeota archaeon]|nr:hypothetical protein [Candidatus Pacearchaeota archaeon]